MSYIEDKVNNLQDDEYRKALTYTVGSAAVATFFGAASVQQVLDGDIETAKSGAAMASFSGALTKGLYNRTQELDEVYEGEPEEYDLEDILSVD